MPLLKPPLLELVLAALQCKKIKVNLLFLLRYVHRLSHALPVLKGSAT